MGKKKKRPTRRGQDQQHPPDQQQQSPPNQQQQQRPEGQQQQRPQGQQQQGPPVPAHQVPSGQPSPAGQQPRSPGPQQPTGQVQVPAHQILQPSLPKPEGPREGASALPSPQGPRPVPGSSGSAPAGASGPGSSIIPRVNNVDERKKRAGKEGKRLNVRVNHFPLVTSLKKAYHYDVEVTTPFKRENRKSDKDLFFRAFEKLKKVYTQEFKRPFGVVFDGLKNAYSSHELFPSGSFEGKVELPEVEDLPEKLIELTIKLTLVGAVDVKSAIDSFCRQGSSSDTTVKGATQVINTIFGHMGHADNKLLTIGPTVFPKNQGRVIDIGRGRSLWHGTYLSFRPAWKPFLNVEMVSKPGYEEGSVLDFCSKVDYFNPQKMPPGQIKNISKELKGLKCRFERPDGHKRDYRANGLGPVATAPTAVQIERDGKTLEMSVQQYFMEEYKHKLEFPNYYTLHVGNPDRKIYLPIDMCKIKKQACPNNKKLTEDQTAQMIRFTAVTPEERKKRIEDGLRSMSNAFKQDPYAQEFGINVEGNMTTIPARMLDPPQLRYKGDKADVNENPSNGKWRMNKGAKFVDSKDLIRWAIMDLAGLQDQQIDTFVRGLTRSAWFCGLTIRPPSGKERCDLRRERDKAENKFRRLVTSMKDPQLVMVFSAGKDPMYSILKHVGDIDLKVPTQFVLKKNVFGKRGSPDPDAQTLHNICLKINSKLGGKNHDLSNTSRPEILKKPVMLIGADVTHPSPEAMGQKPSIAAMVASCDPLGLIYNCEVRLQWREGSDGKTKVEEVIKDTQGMIRLLLVKFYKATKQKPEKLIFYRDGVSEGQFLDVLNRELSAIRRACASLPGDYKPGITFLVAQKRHKTRLFPENPGKDGVGRMKNVPPGTVVDTDITSPTEESFFLASHEGIQGTTKPCRYHKLWDDNNLSPDQTQMLTYFLCHIYARCERSVSYPAPTYYAHLAAFRAREHHNALIDKGLDRNEVELEKLEHPPLVDYYV